MWGRNRKTVEAKTSADAEPGVLQEAVRKTRVEIAEKSSVVVDLRDAAMARLELLNDALDPLFNETPPDVDLFDRGISGAIPRGCGSTPSRMWRWRGTSGAIVSCRTRGLAGRSLRIQTTSPRSSRRSPITSRPASSSGNGRWAEDEGPSRARLYSSLHGSRRRSRWRMIRAFMYGLIAGCIALLAGVSGWSLRGCRINSIVHANSGWRSISQKLPPRQPRETIVQRHAPLRALDLIKVVAGRFVTAFRRARGRRYADHRNAKPRAWQPMQRGFVMVAMQHEFRAVLAQHIAERSGIRQPAKIMRAFDRRMMDQDDAERLLALRVSPAARRAVESDRCADVRSRPAAPSAATSTGRSAPAARAAARREMFRPGRHA